MKTKHIWSSAICHESLKSFDFATVHMRTAGMRLTNKNVTSLVGQNGRGLGRVWAILGNYYKKNIPYSAITTGEPRRFCTLSLKFQFDCTCFQGEVNTNFGEK